MIAVVLLASLTIGDVSSVEALKAIDRHEAAQGRIHSLRAKITAKFSLDKGASWRPLLEDNVLRNGQQERIHEKLYGTFFASQFREGIQHRDFAYAPSEFRLLAGVDPSDPPGLPINGLDDPQVNGVISTPPPLGSYGHKALWTQHALIIPQGGQSLRDLYNLSKTKTVTQENEIWKFDLKPPGEFSYVIKLSQPHNFAISEVETKYVGNREAGVPPYDRSETVEEFYDFEQGFSIAKKIKVQDSMNQKILMERVIEVESINKPVPEDELALNFPEGTEVNDGINMRFHIWGKGKPGQSFLTGDEINAWTMQRDLDVRRSRQRSVSPLVLGAFLAATAALIALFAMRRRMTRSLRANY